MICIPLEFYPIWHDPAMRKKTKFAVDQITRGCKHGH
jgi:hypothetical protein